MTTPSTEPSGATLADEFEAALDWWKAAGVDQDYADDATDWLEAPAESKDTASQAKPKPKAKPIAPAPPPPKKIGGDAGAWPKELDAFTAWLAQSKEVDDGGAFPVVGPRGGAKPELMIIVAEPEEQDTGTLLSGPQGRMLNGMLQAIGVDAQHSYLASALRRHTPMPDWAALKSAGLGELLLHHISLVQPNRILALGRNIPPLLGNDTAQGAPILLEINQDNSSIPVMGAGSLSELLRSAPRRQRFWHNWLEWTDPNKRNN